MIAKSYQEMVEQQAAAEALASTLLADVRSQLAAKIPELDSVGADALMLNALIIRAGRHRYYWPTLEWLVQTAYRYGHRPYEEPLLGKIYAEAEYPRYSPFDLFHDNVFDLEEEDYMDPLPDHARPLRFLDRDLYRWELELGTSNEDTHKLLRGEALDEPAA